MRAITLSTDDDATDGGLDVARAIRALGDNDLVRLQTLARLRARGCPGLDWPDLLHEAILRGLSGSRQWPAGVSVIAGLTMTMRSIADEHWRRVRRERRPTGGEVGEASDDHSDNARQETVIDPERILAAVQALAALDRLFAHDPAVLAIIAGLADGLSAAEIRLRHGLTEVAYDTARKRMRRALLRHDPMGQRP